MTVWIGTSGWHYDHWRGLFYPHGLRRSDWLGFYAESFATVELNNAFYRLPTREAFEAWAGAVPADFTVTVKASRYLTHVKRLQEPAQPVQRLVGAARGLGSRLGPILLQFPPNLAVDVAALDMTLSQFPRSLRVAVETRHPSWYDETVRGVLTEHGAAWVLTDPGRDERPKWRTADWAYVRFHRGRGRPESCYTRSPLQTWARLLASMWSPSDDIYCYFNNDGCGCAPRDARRFAGAIRQAGLEPSRVPGPRRTPVAPVAT